MHQRNTPALQSFLGDSYQLRSQALAGEWQSYPLTEILSQLDSSVPAGYQLDSLAATVFFTDRMSQIHTAYDFQPLSMYLFAYHSDHRAHQSLWKLISRYSVFKGSLSTSDQPSLITFFQTLYAQSLQNYMSKNFYSDYWKAKTRYESQLPETQSYLILWENTISLAPDIREWVRDLEKIQNF